MLFNWFYLFTSIGRQWMTIITLIVCWMKLFFWRCRLIGVHKSCRGAGRGGHVGGVTLSLEAVVVGNRVRVAQPLLLVAAAIWAAAVYVGVHLSGIVAGAVVQAAAVRWNVSPICRVLVLLVVQEHVKNVRLHSAVVHPPLNGSGVELKGRPSAFPSITTSHPLKRAFTFRPSKSHGLSVCLKGSSAHLSTTSSPNGGFARWKPVSFAYLSYTSENLTFTACK